MTISTYSELVDEMALWLNRSDLTDRIPTFIRLFEARMNRRLRGPDMESTYTQDTVAGTEAYALPSASRQVRQIYLDTDPKVVLTAMTPAVLRNTYPDSLQSQPQAYAVEGESILFAPIPDAAYTITISTFDTLSGLSSGNETNWLLDDHPDLYLFGSLARAEAYLKDDERLVLWKSAEDEILGEIVKEGNAKRNGAAPLQMQPTTYE